MGFFDNLKSAVSSAAATAGDRFLETGSAFAGNVFDAVGQTAADAFSVFDTDESFLGFGLSALGVTPAEGVPLTEATERASIPSARVRPALPQNPFAFPRPDVSESPNSRLTSSGSAPGAGQGGLIFGLPSAVVLGGGAVVTLGMVILLTRR